MHRGLLVGTGPLVDPGFRGKLLIPLHNLTLDAYEIRGDEGLIWVEFTKTSFKPEDEVKEGTQEALDAWESRKNNMTPAAYFEKANNNRPIRSSIPAAIAETRIRSRQAEEAAKEAAASSKRRARSYQILSAIGAITILGTIATLLSFFEAVKGNVNSAVTLASTIGGTAERAASDAKSAQGATEDLKSQIDKAASASAKLDNYVWNSIRLMAGSTRC